MIEARSKEIAPLALGKIWAFTQVMLIAALVTTTVPTRAGPDLVGGGCGCNCMLLMHRMRMYANLHQCWP